MINIWHSDIIVRTIDWSKRVLHAITTTNHGPHPITRRVKGRVEVTTSHFPRSSNMITSHDLWQPHHLPRFLTAARRVVMTLLLSKYHHDNIKYLPAINERNSTPGTIYKPSHEEEGNLLIPNKRPTDLYFPLLPWLTKPLEGASGHPVRMPFAGITTESRTFVCWDRVSIHLATTWNTRSARYQQAPQHVTLINPLFGQPLSSSSYSP